ncbi:ATP binding protein [Aureococcus anophagefferens]|nr:ATP binding protein [Aureococcus anophagefferens]
MSKLTYPDELEAISNAQWMELHGDQLARGGVPPALHAVVAKKLNEERFDAFETLAMDDAEEDTRILRYWGERPVAAYETAWVGDHCLRFGHQRDADGALKAHPGLRLRFGSMAHCDDDDVLDLCVWRFAKALPRVVKGPPTFYLEDELGCAFDYDDTPNGDKPGPRMGSAVVVCRRSGDSFTVYWPTALTKGDAPVRDPRTVANRWAAALRRDEQTLQWRAAAEEKTVENEPGAPRPRDGVDGAALKVFTDADWVKNELRHAAFALVDDVAAADIVFVHSGGGQYASKITKDQKVSWYAQARSSARTIWLPRSMAGLEDLAPRPTFDLETELDAALGAMAAEYTPLPVPAEVPVNPFYMLKPYDLGRSIGHCCTNSKHCVLAYADAGGYVLQRYVERPHALPAALGGAPGRKYDVRVVALLRSASPLELYAHDHVYVRAANEAHDLAKLDDVATADFVAAFDADHPDRPFCDVLADCRDTLRRVFAAAADQHAGFRDASPTARAAYGCDFLLDEDLKPYLLEITFAPAPLWSSADMPEVVPGVADDIFACLFLGAGDRVTRC